MKTTANLRKINGNFTSYLLRCIILIFVLNTSIALAQSSSCSALLKVEKDRNTRSTPSDGTYYSMLISNNGTANDVFRLSALNVNSTCANTDGSDTSKNVKLNPVFLDANRNPISEINVNRGQTVSFYVRMLVPANTQVNRWSCIQVVAKPSLCSSYETSTILHTLVINPSEDN